MRQSFVLPLYSHFIQNSLVMTVIFSCIPLMLLTTCHRLLKEGPEKLEFAFGIYLA